MNFGEKYNREDWVEYFSGNLEYKEGVVSGQEYIIEKHSDYLEDITWLGDLHFDIDDKVSVYELVVKNIKLTTKTKISKICTDTLRDGHKESHGKGIFFILYSDNKNQYRISYVKYDKIANENFEIEKDISDPKRYTYLLGEGVKVKTAQSRLTKEAFLSVKDIEEAFSVEPVNKEFYSGIKYSFDKIYKDIFKGFKVDENQAKEFSLRFLGRMLFCWFLKEKDLIPKEVFEEKVFVEVKENYYKEVLSELFFNVLNVKME